MFCPKCGNPIPEDSLFCANCGNSIANRFKTPSGTPSIDQASIQSIEDDNETNAKPPTASKKKAIIAAGAAAFACAIVAICAFALPNFDESGVSANFKAIGYKADSSPVAVQVSGASESGKSVDDEYCLQDGSMKLMGLEYGTYEVTLPASPILADGTMFSTEGVSATIEYSESAPSISLEFDLSALDPVNVTNEQIEASKKMIIRCGCSEQQAEEYVKPALDRRADAIARQEAKQKAQEEEEANRVQAARHIEAATYSFDIPEYWVGKVNVQVDGDQVRITDIQSGNKIAYTDRSDHLEATLGGDPGFGLAFHVEGPDGNCFSLRSPGYEYLRENDGIRSSMNLSIEDCERLANIQTCGQGSASAGGMMAFRIMEDNIAPTVQFK